MAFLWYRPRAAPCWARQRPGMSCCYLRLKFPDRVQEHVGGSVRGPAISSLGESADRACDICEYPSEAPFSVAVELAHE